LKSRSPLPDPGLAVFGARMPTRLKVRRTLTKVVLRRPFDGRQPAGISERPKQGFLRRL